MRPPQLVATIPRNKRLNRINQTNKKPNTAQFPLTNSAKESTQKIGSAKVGMLNTCLRAVNSLVVGGALDC